jgi:four helix bundle protein
MREVLPRIRKHDPDLFKQARRAMTSVPLNLKEGNRRLGRDRVHHFSIAAGSADELVSVLEVSEAAGYLGRDVVEPVLGLLDRELGMLWGLTH